MNCINNKIIEKNYNNHNLIEIYKPNNEYSETYICDVCNKFIVFNHDWNEIEVFENVPGKFFRNKLPILTCNEYIIKDILE